MAGVGRRLNVRLFLEGVEIPVISHAISMQKNAAATCSIQVLSSDYALDLKPRTLVHLFEYDQYKASPVSESTGVTGGGIRVIEQEIDPDATLIPAGKIANWSRKSSQVDLENQNYRLAFTGEIIGFSFNKTPRARSITLQCIDLSSYWDLVLQYQVSGFSFGHGGIKASFTGASTKVFRDFLKGSGDIVLEMLETAPRSNPELKGTLIGGLTNIIEMVGGVYYGKRAVRGVNDFFSVAEMRLHISQMVAAHPFAARDELRLLKRRGFGSLFSRNLSGLGKQVSIRAILLALQKYIFHEIVPVPAPRFLPSEGKLETQFVPATLRELPATMAIHNALNELKGGFQTLLDSQENGVTEGADELLSLELGARIASQNVKDTNADGAVKVGKAVSSALDAAESAAKEMYQYCSTSSAGSSATIPLTGPGAQKFKTKGTAAIKKLQTAMSTEIERRVTAGRAQGDPPARLFNQVYKPDVWMVSPPRCNVLFPEQYMNLSYSRNYAAEVTRLLLRTHDAFFGSDYLFDGYYTTPNQLIGARSGKLQAGGKTNQNPGDIDSPAFWRRDLMDHELYTGILPKFERMSDLNLHAIRGGKIKVDGQQIPYAALAANHIFFQYRFRSRQLEIQGRYNPFVVLGFPMLVIDKHSTYNFDKDVDRLAAGNIAQAAVGSSFGPPDEIDLDNFERAELLSDDIYDAVLKARENTHYLGTPMAIQHTAAANSGSQAITNVSMEYARTTNERTEFLGDNMSQSKKKLNRNIPTEVAALEPPRVGGVGIRGGTILEVTDITDQFEKSLTKKQGRGLGSTPSKRITGTKLPLYDGGAVTGRTYSRDSKVVVGVEQPASAYNNAQVVAMVGSTGRFQANSSDSSQILVKFSAYRIVEELSVRARKSTQLSPEDLTFPPWFGEHYRSKSVGGVYAYFFGTGSITDETSFKWPSGRSPNPLNDLPGSAADIGGFSTAGGTGPAGVGDALSRTDEQVSVEDPFTQSEVQEAGGRHPIRQSVDKLVEAYSRVKLDGLDVDEFIKSYTWRPVASMVDILGTSDLVINDQGTVTTGYEGFHSRAFGNYDDLRTLVDQNDTGPRSILGVDVVDPSDADATTIKRNQRIAEALDTRKEKRLAVLRYLQSIMAQRGFL